MVDSSLRDVATDDKCFVCGKLNQRGLHAEFEVDRTGRTSRCRLSLPDDYQGWQDVVHGGILATLLDEACIYACRSVGEQFVTAEITVRFHKPVGVGEELTVTGELLEQRKRICRVAAQILVDGVVRAEATARVFALDGQ